MKKGSDTQKFDRCFNKLKKQLGKEGPMLYATLQWAAKVRGGVKIPEMLEERNRMIPVYPMILLYTQLWWHV
ncbi:MAG TPA: hypothetical protein VFY68_13875 [Nitrososphaeraceae archaeon]|nr:hypothetical protein [Nitrososphaeraceae archaeon]